MESKSSLALLFFLSQFVFGFSEWFSSLSQMEDLVKIEENLIISLKNHISFEREKLEQLTR